MANGFFENQDISNQSFAGIQPGKAEYLDCTFLQCDFTGARPGKWELTNCRFIDCNFSMAQLGQTRLRQVNFTGCKLMGIDFSLCDPFLFAANFERCNLDYASFYQMKLKGTLFRHCSMREVNFEGTDLREAVLDECDLLQAVFLHTSLQKADLRSAYHFDMDADANQLKGARFSYRGLPGLLGKYGIITED